MYYIFICILLKRITDLFKFKVLQTLVTSLSINCNSETENYINFLNNSTKTILKKYQY